jgi:hypothetical protein
MATLWPVELKRKFSKRWAFLSFSQKTGKSKWRLGMREGLAKIEGSRRMFQGVFVRFGKKRGFKGPLTTILLKDIQDIVARKVVTDHLWFTMGKRMARLDLKEGDVVKFEARVTEYLKGYKGRRDEDDFEGNYQSLEYDYRLSFPTKIVKLQAVSPDQIQLTSFATSR